MNTKTCKGCGWVYPKDWAGRTCRFCHTPFTEGICAICGEYAESLHNYRCRSCESKEHAAWRKQRINNAEVQYKDWRKKIASLPYPYKTLTEEQWLEACKHFGACAYCGEASIDARSMFIPFKYGGRYCAWNIIPACEKCETSRKDTPNPFIRMDQKLKRGRGEQAKKFGFNLDNLQRIVDYLQSKMEEATNERR